MNRALFGDRFDETSALWFGGNFGEGRVHLLANVESSYA